MHLTRLLCFCLVTLFGPGRLWAEPLPSAFFRDGPLYAESPRVFPGLAVQIAGVHVLNQDDSPLFGNELKTLAEVTLFSAPELTIRFGLTEDFRFLVNPHSRWFLWARDLVTHIELSADVPLRLIGGPGSLGLVFHHDCKHDMEVYPRRTAVHDSLGLRWFMAWPGFSFSPDLTWAAETRLGAEVFFGQVFQQILPEPYRAKAMAEARTRLGSTGPGFGLVAEGRVAALLTGSSTTVQIEEGWHFDGRLTLGADLRAGLGTLRLAWYADRTRDPWIDENPQSAFTHGLTFGFDFAARD